MERDFKTCGGLSHVSTPLNPAALQICPTVRPDAAAESCHGIFDGFQFVNKETDGEFQMLTHLLLEQTLKGGKEG